jgi:hypothetical protein
MLSTLVFIQTVTKITLLGYRASLNALINYLLPLIKQYLQNTIRK